MFKGWSREHKKIRHDHLCKTSQWPFIFDSSQLYLVSHKKVWLTVCRSPPVIPTDTSALSYLSSIEEHIKRRLKLKLKNKVIQCMVKSADDELDPEIQNKSQDWKIIITEMYQTGSSCRGFSPVLCRCHKWCNVDNHIISSDPFVTMYNQYRIQSLSALQCQSMPGCQQQHVWWSKLISVWMSHSLCYCLLEPQKG